MGNNSPARRAMFAAVTTVFTTGLVVTGSSVAQPAKQDSPWSAPGSAAPAASASTYPATARLGPGTWYIKNAKNVSSKPPRRTSRNKVVCTYVHGYRAVTLGKACFQPSGDKFWVWDRRSDGMHVVMRAMYSGNPQTLFDCRNFKGKDAGWTRCGFARQLKENRKINFNILAYKGNRLKYDGSTVTAQN